MAIEIKELHIRVNVENKSSKKDESTAVFTNEMKSKLIKECVAKVFEKLESKLER